MTSRTTWEQDGAVLTARVYDGLVRIRMWASEEHVLATAVFSSDESLTITARAAGSALVDDPTAGDAYATAVVNALAELGYPMLDLPDGKVLEDAVGYALGRAERVNPAALAR